MSYPNRCIKGIPSKDAIVEGRNSLVASAILFQFRGDRVRDDSFLEESINWMDDKDAIDFTLKQTKANGKLQFPIGVALLATDELKLIGRRLAEFSYERQGLQDNSYHGNLLLHANVSSSKKALVKATLAWHAEVKPREEYSSVSGDWELSKLLKGWGQRAWAWLKRRKAPSKKQS